MSKLEHAERKQKMCQGTWTVPRLLKFSLRRQARLQEKICLYNYDAESVHTEAATS